jgi:hypothetical protein
MNKTLSLWITSGLVILVVSYALISSGSAFALRSVALSPMPPMTFTVTNNNDTGDGSLRVAIDQANTNPGTDLINFNPGIGTINVTGIPLPAITEAVTIDGGSPKTELNGDGAGGAADGLLIMTNGVTIKNMVINRFSGVGINIQGDGNNVQGNFIGTNVAGTSALGNASGGVLVAGANNVIGGTTAAARNVISGNGSSAVTLNGNISHDNTVLGNFIGTDASGAGALANNGTGVGVFSGAFNNTIGGLVAGAGNTIAFNAGRGISIPGGVGNGILANSISNNEQLGIDLSDDAGVTPNDDCDPDTGANGLQNFPVLTSAASGGGMTTIQGSLNSTAVSTFRIEFFSSPSCDSSGNGQGAVFRGATNVSTSAACVANINLNLGIAVPVGQVITATATDSANNTSEFSACVMVVNAPSCSVNCPADVFAFTGPNAISCKAPVSYSAPTTSGTCGAVTCTPPSGSIFDVGTTTVNCSEGGGTKCSFNVTVDDTTRPRLTCSTGVTTTAQSGKTSKAVDFPAPTATDNCSPVDINCSPPSGSTFNIGTTLVTCSGTDSSLNTTLCFFNVTVLDAEGPVIVCPASVNVSPAPGQTSAVVTYPPPSATDNLPGVTTACSPASGSTFPLGTTPVTCTATDATGNRSSCTFSVSVGGPQAKVTIPAGGASVEFGNPTPIPSRRKPQKQRNNPCSLFIIENIGFAPLVLTFDSINRVGADVDNGKIGAPSDLKYFTMSLVTGGQSQTELNVGDAVNVQPRGAQTFCLRFSPLLPGLAGKTTGIAAADDLPDTMTSRVTFRQNGGAPISVPVLSHVGTALTLINPSNPRRSPVVGFSRSGNNFDVSYAVHDSNGDISKAKYEFLDSSGQVIGEAFETDLAEPIRALNPVRGQSIGVEQSFTGANDHPEVTGVRVTVFDGETSATGSASATAARPVSAQLLNRKQGVTLLLPKVRLKPLFPL